MGTMILILFALLLLMCFCIYNWWFLKEKNKRIPSVQRTQVSILNNHVFWGIGALAILLIILGITAYELYILIVNIMKMQM